jgi:O-antigen/teichoic acid export membrane protein
VVPSLREPADQVPSPASGAGEPAARKPGLADSAARGFVLFGIQSVGVRVVRFAGNFALAWVLIPDDFTLYMLVLTVSQFVSVLRNAGVRDIIVHRQQNARRWVNAGAWLSGSVGLVLGVLMAATAPLVAMFFERPALIPLIWIMSGATFLQSLSQAPVGLLQARMRFRLLATIEGVQSAGMMLHTVYCAFMGMGAMSFVLPIFVGAACRTAAVWYFAKPEVYRRPQLRRWRYLIGDSTRLVSADVARTITLQGDMIVLGKMFPGLTAVGHYAFGNSISRQSMMMISRNLDFVLFPSLAKIQGDPVRQNAAFVRALRLLALVGVPLCFLQAAVADPLIHALVPERFYGTIPFIVVLSIGMAGRLMISPAESMLRSQGRFSTFSTLNWVFAGLYTLGALVGALFMGDAMGVAIMIGAVTGLGGVIYVLVALSRSEKTVRATARVFATPTIASTIACGLGWWASTFVPRDSVAMGLAACALVCVITGAVYLPIAWVFERTVCDELFARVTGVLGARLGGRVARLLPSKA